MAIDAGSTRGLRACKTTELGLSLLKMTGPEFLSCFRMENGTFSLWAILFNLFNLFNVLVRYLYYVFYFVDFHDYCKLLRIITYCY